MIAIARHQAHLTYLRFDTMLADDAAPFRDRQGWRLADRTAMVPGGGIGPAGHALARRPAPPSSETRRFPRSQPRMSDSI